MLQNHRVDYLFGLARNTRLTAELEPEMTEARAKAEKTGQPARRFRDFTWSTLESWSRTRRVIGKAEWTGGEANLRFVVTSLSAAEAEAWHLCGASACRTPGSPMPRAARSGSGSSRSARWCGSALQ